jgi:cytochrome bd-type quinol oxidase subunit 1
MKIFGYVCSYLILMPLSITFSGYALSVLWDWFVAVTFGVESLSIPAAIGLSLIINYITYQYNEQESDSSISQSERLGKAVFMAMIRPSLALLTGWIVTMFM